jgi:hypothetical protein
VLFSHSFCLYVSNFRHSDWSRTQNVNKRADWLKLFALVTAGQRTFHYRAVKIWNDIDDELKKIPELKVFKKKLKEHLLNS